MSVFLRSVLVCVFMNLVRFYLLVSQRIEKSVGEFLVR